MVVNRVSHCVSFSCAQSLSCNFAVSKSTWLQHLGDKFHEVLQVNAKSMQGASDSIPFTTDGYGEGTTPTLDVRIRRLVLITVVILVCFVVF